MDLHAFSLFDIVVFVVMRLMLLPLVVSLIFRSHRHTIGDATPCVGVRFVDGTIDALISIQI